MSLSTQSIPPLLKEINDPPQKLYVRGKLPNPKTTCVCIVGARRYSSYGKEVCEKIVSTLANHNVSIISGLALGIDSIAHTSALKHGLHTVAVPGSGLNPEVLYPRSHRSLAENIVSSGGALVSEFEPDFKATQWSFPKRNRIMAGLSHIVVVIEAEKKSGTLITARLAMEYNRDVATVPGSIFSKNSEGPHHLIRNGAIPLSSPSDILEAVGINDDTKQQTLPEIDLTEKEKTIVSLLHTEPLDRSSLLNKTSLSASECAIVLSQLELKGVVTEHLGMLYLNLPN